MNKLLLSFLVGIGLGILIAPAKGSETIKKLKDRFDDFKDNLRDTSGELVDGGKRIIKKAKNVFESAQE